MNKEDLLDMLKGLSEAEIKELYMEANGGRKWDGRYNRPRILIDMDDCINNFLPYLIRVYNKRTGDHVKPSDIKDWDISKYMDRLALDIFHEEGFFEDVPEKKKSISTLKKLIESAKYDVYIITACQSPRELQEKIEWFNRCLPSFNKNRIIMCKEKHIIRGDVLIDDNTSNLEKCKPFMKTIVFDMPHNKDYKADARIKKLEDAVALIEKWFYPEDISLL